MREAFELIDSLEDESIDLILTDVPYGIELPINITLIRKETKNWDWDKDWRNNPPVNQLCERAFRVLKPSGQFVAFCNWEHIGIFHYYAKERGHQLHSPWVWKKTNPPPQYRKDIPWQAYEQAVWITKLPKSNATYNKGLYSNLTNVLETPIIQNEFSGERHPAQSPLYIGLLLIALLSKQNDIVLDPYTGSGTFPVAAKLLDREPIWAERDPKWFKVCEERLENWKLHRRLPGYKRFIKESKGPGRGLKMLAEVFK